MKAEKRLAELGFELLPGRGKGAHRLYMHPDGRWTVDDGGEVSRTVLASIRRAIRPDEL